MQNALSLPLKTTKTSKRPQLIFPVANKTFEMYIRLFISRYTARPLLGNHDVGIHNKKQKIRTDASFST